MKNSEFHRNITCGKLFSLIFIFLNPISGWNRIQNTRRFRFIFLLKTRSPRDFETKTVDQGFIRCSQN